MTNQTDLIRRGDARLAILYSLKAHDALSRLDQVEAVEVGSTSPSDLPPHAIEGFIRALRHIQSIASLWGDEDNWRAALDEIKGTARAALAAWEGKSDE